MKMRVSYARRRYKDKIYVTPLVVTSFRDENGITRHKTLANLAKLPAPIVEMIDHALKRGDTDILNEYVPLSAVEVEDSICIGPAFTVLSLCRELGIHDLIFKYLPEQKATGVLCGVVERVLSLDPMSSMALQRNFVEEPLSMLLDKKTAPCLKTWYRGVGCLERHRESILRELYFKNCQPTRVYLYDITSSYFEGKTCPLAARGYNRDGKKNKLQIVIGVICDGEGCPIWVEVFKGNTSDQTTVKQQLLNLKNKLGIIDFIFVGDRGMLTHARIEELEKEGWWEQFGYITALTRKEIKSIVQDPKHPLQLNLFDGRSVVEVPGEGVRYIICHNPSRQEQDRATRETLLEKTEEKLKKIQKTIVSGKLKAANKIAEKVSRWKNRWKVGRLFSINYGEGFLEFARLADEIEKEKKLDGYYVIRSNVDETKESASGLRDRYKELKWVEQAFRTMKTTEIQIQPIRHRNTASVKGHVIICFLAYRVLWEIRQRLSAGLKREGKPNLCELGSLDEVWKKLGKVSLVRLEAGKKAQWKITRIRKETQAILTALRVPSINRFLGE